MSTSCDDRMLRRIKQNMVTMSSYIVLSFLKDWLLKCVSLWDLVEKKGFFVSRQETDKRMRSKKFKISFFVHLPTVHYCSSDWKYSKEKFRPDKNFIVLNVSGENRKWRKKNWNPLNTSSIKCLSSKSDLFLDLTQFLRFRMYKNCIKEKEIHEIFKMSPRKYILCSFNHV